MEPITVIIPCYNAAKYVAEAIESVLRQTRTVREIILIDDHSTDDSVAVARKFPVTILRTEKNSGPAGARNVGFRAVQTEFIAQLDADDTWEPNHCEVVAALLERYPEADVAFASARYFGERDGLYPPSPCHGQPRDVFWDSFRGTIVQGSSAITRRAALMGVGGFDASIRIAPDYDFWLRMSRHSRFVSTPEVTVNYRWHATQISRQPLRQLRSIYESRKRLLDNLRRESEDPLARQVAARLREIWGEDLAIAWHSRRMDYLRLLLGLSDLVPEGESLRRRWARRAWLPAPLLRSWDQVQALVRG
jgi:glycosyltransferase involved in cell wall biosynthesis